MKHTMTIRRGAEGETVRLPTGELIPLDQDIKNFLVKAFASATNQPMPRRAFHKQHRRNSEARA